MEQSLYTRDLRSIFTEYYSQLSALESYVESIEELLLERHKKRQSEHDEDLEIQEEIIRQLLSKTIEDLNENMNNEVAATLDKGEDLEGILSRLKETEEKFGKNNTSINADIDFGESENSLSIKFHDIETKKRFDNYFSSLDEVRDHTTLLYRSSLITLAVTFELLINNMLHYRADKYPNSINIDKRSLTFSEIERIGSFEEAKNYIVEQYVTEIMRQSNEQWLAHIKTNFKITLDKEIEHYERTINEVYNRRNLVVHGGEIVNTIYLANVEEEFRKGLKKGDKIKIDKDYILSSIETFKVYGLSLMYLYWMSMEKNNEDRAKLGQKYAFEMLEKQQYLSARQLYKTILKDTLSQELNYLIRINYWQTFKWQGDFHEIESDVKSIDFSASKPIYQMCKNLLLDKKQEAIESLKEVLLSGEWSLIELLDWPIIQPLYTQSQFTEILEREGITIDTED